MTSCRYDRESRTHLLREHKADCTTPGCKGCLECRHDDSGNPVRHCRIRLRCTSHLGWDEHACPTCLGKVRANLSDVVDLLALMPAEAEEQGVNSEAANLAGPHADYVTAQWRLVNADRAGQSVEELDLRDPYTSLTLHERTIREDLGHDEQTLVSPTVTEAAGYLAWVLTDLARDEEHAEHVRGLLVSTNELVAHMEAARRDARTPERGAPCPVCVEEEQAKAEADPERKQDKRMPRLVRVYGHWCTKTGCERLHYLDDGGDVWRCASCGNEWSHEDYSRWIEERRSA